MKHLVNWVEIPAGNFERAVKFYSEILETEIISFEIDGARYGMFPTDDQKNAGALVKSDFHQPSANGVMIYLDGGDDLTSILAKVKDAGGEVLMEKTYLGEQAGYVGIFSDSEGNKIGLQHN